MSFAGASIAGSFWTVQQYLYICYATFSISTSIKGYVRPFGSN